MRTARFSFRLEGVSAWGCLPGGTAQGGCLPRGVSALGGVGICLGDVCPGGVHPHSLHAEIHTLPCEQNQTVVKTLPCPKLRLRGGGG